MSDADSPKQQMARLWGFDRDIATLEARIAELERERDEQEQAHSVCHDNDQSLLEEARAELVKQRGVSAELRSQLADATKLVNVTEQASVASQEASAAARAERDEAKELLGEYRKLRGSPCQHGDHRAEQCGALDTRGADAMGRLTAIDDPRRRLADDLAAMLRFTRNHPDVDYMAGLLLGLMREGRYDEPEVRDEQPKEV